MIHFLVQTYFNANLFLAGYNFDKDSHGDSLLNWRNLLFTLIMLVFGLVIYTLNILLDVWEYLSTETAYGSYIRFFFTYHFTKRWHNLDENRLYKINQLSAKRNKNTFEDKIWRYLIKKINERNNYTYKPHSNE